MPRITTPLEAVSRARSLVGRGTYALGTGGYKPSPGIDEDLDPWIPHPRTNQRGDFCDCWGLVSWAFRQRRHRPGYNPGGSVTDDINTDSAIEDASRIPKGAAKPRAELWQLVDTHSAQCGDLIVYPSIRGPGGERLRIGHVGIICAVDYPVGKGLSLPFRVIQCSSQQPLGAAIRETDARAWEKRDRWQGTNHAKFGSVVLLLSISHENSDR
jgi:hypothetical protein